MHKTGVVLIAITALAFALTGCGDDSTDTATDTTARGFANVEQADAPATEETPEPLVADAEASEASNADTVFLDWVHGQIDEAGEASQITEATDAQLIASGHEACTQLDAGVPREDVRLVEGETPHPVSGYFIGSAIIRGGAELAYCEQHLHVVN